MKVSIITPTIRENGLELVSESLKGQLFTDYEWLIGSPFDSSRYGKWVRDDFEGGFWSLNRIYNELFRQARGDIVVSWQDFIWANEDALTKFVDRVEETGGVVAGVGDQYSRLDKYGVPELKVWDDPRRTTEYGMFYECHYNSAEFNFCAFPRRLAFDVGGFDEELDFRGYGGDQLQFCHRLCDMGVRFYLDQFNESYTLRHTRDDFGGEDKWNSKHVLFNGEYDRRLAEIELIPTYPALSYLS